MYLASSPFVQGDSFVHHLEPRVKIFVAAWFSVTMAISTQFPTLLLGASYSLALLGLVRPPLHAFLKRFYTLNLLTGFLFLLLLSPDVTMNLRQVTLLTVKSNTMLCLLTTLISTIETMTLAHALHHLGLPHKLIHLLLFTVRYIEILHREYQRLLQAMKLRSFQPGLNRHTYRSFAYLLGMLLVKSLDRSERILAAMKCRGFQGKFFLLDHLSLQSRDYFFTSVSLLFLLGMVIIECLSP